MGNTIQRNTCLDTTPIRLILYMESIESHLYPNFIIIMVISIMIMINVYFMLIIVSIDVFHDRGSTDSCVVTFRSHTIFLIGDYHIRVLGVNKI